MEVKEEASVFSRKGVVYVRWNGGLLASVPGGSEENPLKKGSCVVLRRRDGTITSEIAYIRPWTRNANLPGDQMAALYSEKLSEQAYSFIPIIQQDIVDILTEAEVSIGSLASIFVSENQWNVKKNNSVRAWIPSLRSRQNLFFSKGALSDNVVILRSKFQGYLKFERTWNVGDGSVWKSVPMSNEERSTAGMPRDRLHFPHRIGSAEYSETESTYSGVFVLPGNPDFGVVPTVLVIPNPNPDDEWTKNSFYEDSWGNDVYVKSCSVGSRLRYVKFHLTGGKVVKFVHQEGKLLAREFGKRARLEEAKCLSWTRWVRPASVAVEVEEEVKPLPYTGVWPDRRPPRVILSK